MFMTNKVKSLFFVGCTTIAMLLNTSEVKAQQVATTPQAAPVQNYSDAELQKFANATQEIQKVQMEFQQQMMNAVKAEGIEPMKFQQMAQAQQSGKEVEYSDEEQKAFDNAMNKVMTMQQEVQANLETKLKAYDISMEQYQTMAMSIRQSEEMSKKVQSLMQGS